MEEDSLRDAVKRQFVLRIQQWQFTLNVERRGPRRIVSREIWRYIPYVGFMAICLIIGYLAVARRGYYFDEYIYSDGVFITYPARMLAEVLRASLLDRSFWLANEPVVWVLTTCVITANALLTGSLAYRLSHSRAAFWSVVCLSTFPIWAFEATLWFSASTVYLTGTFFALLSLHFFLTSLTSTHQLWLWLVVICFSVALLFGEFVLSILLLFPILALTARLSAVRRIVFRMAVVLGVLFVVSLVIYFTLYASSQIHWRLDAGGNVLSPSLLLERSAGFFSRTYWMTLDPLWGVPLNGDALTHGIHVLAFSPWLYLLAGIAVLLLVYGTIVWNLSEDEAPQRTAFFGLAIVLGLIWSVASLLLPGILVPGQIVEYRMLYLPGLGIALVVGVGGGYVTRAARHAVVTKLWLVVCGLAALLLSIGMVGYADAFRLRYQTDQRYLSAYAEQLSALPQAHPMTVVTYITNDKLDDVGQYLTRQLLSVFDVFYIVSVNTQRLIDRDDITYIAFNRWESPGITMDESAPTTNIMVRDQAVPIDQVLIMTVRDGRILPVESAEIVEQGITQTVTFPLAKQLSARGFETLTDVVYAS